MGLFTWIRSKDLFGQKVELSFNGEGSQHNTYIGGFVSIIVRTFITIFTLSLFIKLLTFSDDTISTIFTQQEQQELESMYLNNSGYIPVYMISNIITSEPIFLNEHTARYMKLAIT